MKPLSSATECTVVSNDTYEHYSTQNRVFSSVGDGYRDQEGVTHLDDLVRQWKRNKRFWVMGIVWWNLNSNFPNRF